LGGAAAGPWCAAAGILRGGVAGVLRAALRTGAAGCCRAAALGVLRADVAIDAARRQEALASAWVHCARSSFLSTLFDALTGSVSTKRMWRGTL